MTDKREAVMSESAVSTAHSILWMVCVGVYLTVFISGIQAGGDELLVMGRGVVFTLATGFLGKLAIGLLARASLPVEQGPLADEPGQVGSLVDLRSSTNVPHHEDRADLA